MYGICVFIFIFFCNIIYINSKTFEEITIKIYRHDTPVTKLRADTVNDEKNATEILIEEENIPVLKSGSFQDLPDLKKIILQRNNLETVEEYAFVDLPKLRMISLNFNGIKKIIRNIFANLTVQEVFLRGNGILELDPWSFYNLSQLYKLDLSSNNLRSLPMELFVMTRNLIVLDLSWNHLTTQLGMPSTYPYTYFEEPFWNIQESDESIIDLSFNEIDYIDTCMFHGLSGIKTLLLNNNNVTSIHDGAFDKILFLNMIDLEGNNLEKFSNSILKSFRMVKHINLANNPWNPGFVCKYDIWCGVFRKINTIDANCTFHD